MNAAHLLLGYMPPFQGILFPVGFSPPSRVHVCLPCMCCSPSTAVSIGLCSILQSLIACLGAAQQYKALDATFATIVGVCAFASSVIIGWICEVSSPLLHKYTLSTFMLLA